MSTWCGPCMYDLYGRCEPKFETLIYATDIAVGPGGEILMLDSLLNHFIVFNEDGVKKHQPTAVRFRVDEWVRGLAFHPLEEYFFVVVWSSTGKLKVKMYTIDGEFSREIILREKEPICHPLPSFAISKEGLLAVTCTIGGIGAMVIVI